MKQGFCLLRSLILHIIGSHPFRRSLYVLLLQWNIWVRHFFCSLLSSLVKTSNFWRWCNFSPFQGSSSGIFSLVQKIFCLPLTPGVAICFFLSMIHNSSADKMRNAGAAYSDVATPESEWCPATSVKMGRLSATIGLPPKVNLFLALFSMTDMGWFSCPLSCIELWN